MTRRARRPAQTAVPILLATEHRELGGPEQRDVDLDDQEAEEVTVQRRWKSVSRCSRAVRFSAEV